MNWEEALAWLELLGQFGSRPGLERINHVPVSYTHLDVYKRQGYRRVWQGASLRAPAPIHPSSRAHHIRHPERSEGSCAVKNERLFTSFRVT